MLMGDAVEHRPLRAPREDGGRLIEPPLDAVGNLVAQNAATVAECDYDLQGVSLAHLAAAARAELVETAWRYTTTYRDAARPDWQTPQRVFVAGHQPQLFHPGVWFKNFALGALAQRQGAVAVNLAIDSDTIKTASLRVPTGTARVPRAEIVPFDRPGAEIPYEERLIVDRACLTSFGRRAAETLCSLLPDPLVSEFWPLVIDRSRQCDNLGQCLAQARHLQEGQWGAQTLEIPQSQVCSLPAFRWFASHLLARLPRLWEQYNRSVADYRRANHVRSTAHPVPDLDIDGEWLEAPFWIWDRDNPLRRRLFVKQRGDEIVLADRKGLQRALPLSPEGDCQRAVERLAELADEGIRLRTRALITTLFARLFLGDLFLHGIGGAKYDQVTDLLIERFFGVRPPGYLTLTATLRLPIQHEPATADDARLVNQQLRELVYHPERHVRGLLGAGNGEIATLVKEKQAWIQTPRTFQNAVQRHQAIEAANQRLQGWLADQRRHLIERREHIAAAARAQTILQSREYAFCLYPRDSLRRLMQWP